MSHERLITDVADALVALDGSGVPFKQFRPGIGPYGEPQLVAYVARHLNDLEAYRGLAASKRTPDLLIRGRWALEFKIARPFGDNGNEAENWSVNLLHPYPGNVSVVGDCLKLLKWSGPERKAVVVVGYEHTPPQISLAPLLRAFEVVAVEVAGLRIGKRALESRRELIHPVHQQLTVASWEILGAIEQQHAADGASRRR
jgi:hypothetical protein